MSSQVMSNLLLSKHDQNLVLQTSNQLSPKEKQLIIDGLIAILEEDKLKPLFSNHLRDEFERRYHKRLPEDWLSIVKEVGPEVIEVEEMSYTNVSKTFIQLPIRKSRKSSVEPKATETNGHSIPKTVLNESEDLAVKPTVPLIRADLEFNSPPEPRIATPEPRSETPEPRVAQLISLSPERATDLIKTSLHSLNISHNSSVTSEPKRNRYNSGLDEITSEQSLVPNPVPKTSAIINVSGDEPKAEPNIQTELMNGTVEDVIFGGKAIPSPVLPIVKPNPVNEEDFFDVTVLLAATPYNFIVVPFKNSTESSEFYQMKDKMIDMYEKDENRIDLPPEVIQKGIFVAAKTVDKWCRVEVMSVLSENPFLVVGYLCDYGEHNTFELSNIQPLYNCFRSLPMQAIRASLATVAPIGSDWDAITSYEFRKMVENKPFVATVYDIKQVDGNPVVMLSLCDTSSDDDVYVGLALIAKRLAKPKPKPVITSS